jgi:hypothetical protein
VATCGAIAVAMQWSLSLVGSGWGDGVGGGGTWRNVEVAGIFDGSGRGQKREACVDQNNWHEAEKSSGHSSLWPIYL